MQGSQSSQSFVRRAEVAITGAGFGGVCMAVQLRNAGIRDFVILEKGAEPGGAWRDNHYPGAACDVQSHMYSYSFATKPNWTQRYAQSREIKQYITDVIRKFRIGTQIRCNQEVVSAKFDETQGRWALRTANGDTWSVRYWVLATGPLHVPAIPEIKGMETFNGKIMHSAQWEHGYDFTGKNVVSIGTGGSAIQYAPELAKKAKQLAIFQRSPAWIVPRDDRTYSRLAKNVFAYLPFTRTLHRWQLYWTNEMRVWPIFKPQLAKKVEHLLKTKFIDRVVKDPVLREKLKPDYTLGCKRILISNKWYPMFNRPNVELVTDAIREITPNGIVTKDGQERKADCIVLGTGFVVDPRIYMKDFELVGRGGHTLAEDWKKSPTSYYGMTTANYPNLFQLIGPHSGLGHNSIIFMIEAQVNYIIKCMKLVKKKGADFMDVKPEAQQRFLQEMTDALKNTVWTSGCKSWYQTADGINFAIWPKSTWRFWLETLRVRQDDYEFVSCGSKGLRQHGNDMPPATDLAGGQAMARQGG
jgi:cation diffusion facilitator CzcD-associated flavoprotein CzcO